MWFAWTLVGVAQVWTGRYLVLWWRWRQFSHSVLGGLIGVLTLAGAVVILNWLSWSFYFDHLHNVAGLVFVILGLFLVMGGIFALVQRRVVNNDWKTKQMLQMTMGHRIFGYFMIFSVQIAVISGINRYTIQLAQNIALKQLLICLNVAFWLIAIGLGEILLFMQHRSLVLWKNVNETMTREQFESAIENNIPLVLLDNLVLNVKEFMNQHPGGRFLIRHNIGHDISKYFYGGYCLEGNQGSKPA